eukprot:68341-Pleurochrysis_carterae.AAC.1
MSFGAGKLLAVAVILANEQAAVLVLTNDFYKVKAVIDECVDLAVYVSVERSFQLAVCDMVASV